VLSGTGKCCRDNIQGITKRLAVGTPWWSKANLWFDLRRNQRCAESLWKTLFVTVTYTEHAKRKTHSNGCSLRFETTGTHIVWFWRLILRCEVKTALFRAPIDLRGELFTHLGIVCCVQVIYICVLKPTFWQSSCWTQVILGFPGS
jgi:hypothetical protein